MDELLMFNRALNDSEALSLCDTMNYIPKVIRTTSTLSGQIKSYSKDPLKHSSVYLCKINWTDSSIKVMDTTKTDSLGKYLFTKITNDSTFLLVAEPDTNLFGGDLITFYNKTLFVSKAQEIKLHNKDSVIDFSTLNLYDPAGNYSIYGNVYSCKTCKTSGLPIKNLNIIVTEDYGKTVSYLKTDTMGNFKVTKLVSGKYHFSVNRPAADNSKAPSITINAGNVNNVSFSFNGTALKLQSLTDIEANSISHDPYVTINSKGDGILSLTNPESKGINYSIFNLNGKIIYTGYLPSNKSTNVTIPTGISFFKGIFQDGTIFNSKVIVK